MLKVLGGATIVALCGVAAAAIHHAPSVAAGALLHPSRRASLPVAPSNCVERAYPGAGVTLRGWACAAQGGRRGTIIYLHGIADNRGSGVGAILRYTARGFDVVAYDGRAHGASGGAICSYGVFEKQDLRRVIDTLPAGPIIVVGTSLGAAVALQAAAEDGRIDGVVGAEIFADLDTVARERAPALFPDSLSREAFVEAEVRGGFRIADVSPVNAAGNVTVPVLLIHGAADTDTGPRHSHRVFAALKGPKQLRLVPGARHNESLHRSETWNEVDNWIEGIVGGKS